MPSLWCPPSGAPEPRGCSVPAAPARVLGLTPDTRESLFRRAFPAGWRDTALKPACWPGPPGGGQGLPTEAGITGTRWGSHRQIPLLPPESRWQEGPAAPKAGCKGACWPLPAPRHSRPGQPRDSLPWRLVSPGRLCVPGSSFRFVVRTCVTGAHRPPSHQRGLAQ